MGKSRTDRNGFTREQKLQKEIEKLKRENNRLRKLLARIDLDRYDQVREIIEEHYAKDRKDEGQEILDKMKDEWKCREPECLGFLEIILFNKLTETWYFRRCNCCPNRTKSQKYDPKSVKGIVKE
jgi:hypothetical protein